jgi:holliday junction DNA helicase RuvA
MIATLQGEVAEKHTDLIVLDVHGVGYGVIVSQPDMESSLKGEHIKLYIYEHIREQSHDLFGFREVPAKELFEMLLNVNGVGPKMAMSLLNIGDVLLLKQAIASGDVRYIQAAQGVGKRVAERIVVDLKDKIDVLPGLADSGLPSHLRRQPSAKDEAVQALVSLGYSAQDSAELLDGIDASLPVEERIKQALKKGAL